MINSVINFLKKNKFIIATFVLIFVLFYFISDVITMYYDDYGNASLSYGIIVDNVKGTNYNLSQLLEWTKYIYNNWGGRILYADVFIIPLLKTGIKPYMYAQVFVLTGILFFIYKIIKSFSNGKRFIEFIPILLFVLYSIIDMVYLRDGIYWASASVLYVWPLLPFFALIYFYIFICDKIEKNKKYNYVLVILIAMVLSFFTTFSQEQIGVGLIGFHLSYIFFHHLKDYKKYLKFDIPLFFTTLISYIALFVAPGNWVRMDSNADFASLPLYRKIVRNYLRIMRDIFAENMNIFILLLCILLVFVFIFLIKEYKNNKFRKIYIPIAFVINLVMAGLIVYKPEISKNIFVVGAIGSFWLLDFCISILLYFKKKNSIEFCSIIICGFFTIFCLLVSPVTGGRTCIPLIFFLILIIGKLIIDALNDKIIWRVAVLLLISFITYKGMTNYINIYHGYRNNYSTYKYNDNILRNYTKFEKDKVITLYKVENFWFGSTQPYQEESMYLYIREYYNIPHEYSFEWIDLYEEFR